MCYKKNALRRNINLVIRQEKCGVWVFIRQEKCKIFTKMIVCQ